MRRVTKTIYSVCGHAKKEVTDCEPRQAWLDSGSCLVGWGIVPAPGKCRTDRSHSVIMGFCESCERVYEPVNVRQEHVVLNYWGYKNLRGWDEPVFPELISADVLLNGLGGEQEELSRRLRLELTMLANAIHHYQSSTARTPPKLVRYVQEIRAATLEWARTASPLSPRPTSPTTMTARAPRMEEKPRKGLFVNVSAYKALSGGKEEIPQPAARLSMGERSRSQATDNHRDATITHNPKLTHPPPLVHSPESISHFSLGSPVESTACSAAPSLGYVNSRTVPWPDEAADHTPSPKGKGRDPAEVEGYIPYYDAGIRINVPRLANPRTPHRSNARGTTRGKGNGDENNDGVELAFRPAFSPHDDRAVDFVRVSNPWSAASSARMPRPLLSASSSARSPAADTGEILRPAVYVLPSPRGPRTAGYCSDMSTLWAGCVRPKDGAAADTSTEGTSVGSSRRVGGRRRVRRAQRQPSKGQSQMMRTPRTAPLQERPQLVSVGGDARSSWI